MSIARKANFYFLMLFMAGCASAGDMEVMQRDVDELKTRYFTMEKDFSGLKSETKEGVEKSLKEYRAEIESLRKGTADLQASLEGAQVDMQVLAGKVDDANLQAKKPADDLCLLKEDVDRRFTALEARIGTLEKALEEQQKRGADASPKGGDAPPEAIYQQGVDLVKTGNTQKAREILAKFSEKYPDHELASNARYWIGETYYTEKSYDQAILEFEKVIKNYPDKEKVPAAMLKQGMAFKAIGDAKSGSYIFKKLVEKFPKTAEAASARAKLKEMK